MYLSGLIPRFPRHTICMDECVNPIAQVLMQLQTYDSSQYMVAMVSCIVGCVS